MECGSQRKAMVKQGQGINLVSVGRGIKMEREYFLMKDDVTRNEKLL